MMNVNYLDTEYIRLACHVTGSLKRLLCFIRIGNDHADNAVLCAVIVDGT